MLFVYISTLLQENTYEQIQTYEKDAKTMYTSIG